MFSYNARMLNMDNRLHREIPQQFIEYNICYNCLLLTVRRILARKCMMSVLICRFFSLYLSSSDCLIIICVTWCLFFILNNTFFCRILAHQMS